MPPVGFADTFPRMRRLEPILYLDLVDPGSLVMLRRARSAAADLGIEVEPLPFEIRPPPAPLVDPADPGWTAYWSEMEPALEALAVSPVRPGLVPWTRKAHELVLEAREVECSGDPVDELMVRYIEEGADIGRVDVLLPLARAWGMDLTRTKATLDVDRHADRIDELRGEALGAGVRGVPTLVVGGELLEGVHDEETIRDHLGGP